MEVNLVWIYKYSSRTIYILKLMAYFEYLPLIQAWNSGYYHNLNIPSIKKINNFYPLKIDDTSLPNFN